MPRNPFYRKAKIILKAKPSILKVEGFCFVAVATLFVAWTRRFVAVVVFFVAVATLLVARTTSFVAIILPVDFYRNVVKKAG